jgi:hypothetical protein
VVVVEVPVGQVLKDKDNRAQQAQAVLVNNTISLVHKSTTLVVAVVEHTLQALDKSLMVVKAAVVMVSTELPDKIQQETQMQTVVAVAGLKDNQAGWIHRAEMVVLVSSL